MRPEALAPGVWRLPLPSRTPPPFDHTNTYLVGDGAATVLVDAGSDDPAALGALEGALRTLGLAAPRALLLTHTHADHCAGAEALRERYGLTVYAGELELPRLKVLAQPLEDGATFAVGVETLSAHHTPGHSPGHVSFALPVARTVLVGDLLTAESPSFVGLPDGDVTAYLASLGQLEALAEKFAVTTLGPGHGPPVRDPGSRLAAVRAHRLGREAEVAAALGPEPLTLGALRARVYPALPEALVPLAEGSLGALLAKLVGEGRAHVSVREGETYWRGRRPAER